MKNKYRYNFGKIIGVFAIILATAAVFTYSSMEYDDITEAEEETGLSELEDNYQIKDVNYYNVNSESYSTSPKAFISDMLSGKNKDNMSVIDLWSDLAFDMLICRYGTMGLFTVSPENLAEYLNAAWVESGGYDGTYNPWVSSTTDTWKYFTTGLQTASSKYEADEMSAVKVSPYINGSFSPCIDLSKDKDNVYYINYGVSNSSNGFFGDVDVIFSNIKVMPLFPKDSNLYKNTTDNTDKNSISDISQVINSGDSDINRTMTVTDSTTESTEYSINNTNSYSYSENVEIEAGVETEFFKMGSTCGFNLTDTVEEAIGGKTTQTNSHSKDTTEEVTVPAHTAKTFSHSITDETVSITYNQPVAIQFDVTLVFHYKNANGSSECSIIDTFSNNARKDLAQRAYYDKPQLGKLDSHGIDWALVKMKSNDTLSPFNYNDGQAAAQAIAFSAPCSSAGGTTFSYEQKIDNCNIGEDLSYYQLNKIIAEEVNNSGLLQDIDGKKSLTLKLGEDYDLSDLILKAYDKYGYNYSGFSANEGEWKLEIPGQPNIPITGSKIASVNKDRSGDDIVTAGSETGTLYLVWYPKENTFTSYEQQQDSWVGDKYTSITNLEHPASITLTVTE